MDLEGREGLYVYCVCVCVCVRVCVSEYTFLCVEEECFFKDRQCALVYVFVCMCWQSWLKVGC